MALIKCPECNKKISETVNRCPKCGYQFEQNETAHIKKDMKKSAERSRLFWVLVIIIFFGFPYVMKSFDSLKSANSNSSVPAKNNDVIDINENNYTIIKKTTSGGIKSSIDIRLKKKVSANILKKIAMELRNTTSKKTKNLFVTYYLPGMKPGSGAWATSHFTPELKITILGLTSEDEKKLKSDSQNGTKGSIIGEWLYEIAGAKYTFLKKEDKIIMIRKFKDGSGSETEMIKKKQSGKIRFEEKDGNSFGEYYIIEKNGGLGAYDDSGQITIMPSLKRD